MNNDYDKAARYGTKDEPKFLEKVHAFKVLDVNAREGKPWDVEVQVISLGDQVAWVATTPSVASSSTSCTWLWITCCSMSLARPLIRKKLVRSTHL